jgi:hypothetical protein
MTAPSEPDNTVALHAMQLTDAAKELHAAVHEEAVLINLEEFTQTVAQLQAALFVLDNVTGTLVTRFRALAATGVLSLADGGDVNQAVIDVWGYLGQARTGRQAESMSYAWAALHGMRQG